MHFAQLARKCMSAVQIAVHLFMISTTSSVSYTRTHNVTNFHLNAGVLNQVERLKVDTTDHKEAFLRTIPSRPSDKLQRTQDYVNACDVHFEATNYDPDDIIWTPLQVIDHWIKKHRKQSAYIRVSLFSNEPTWEPLNIIMLQSPYIVCDYVVRNKLFKHPDFWRAIKYLKNKDDLENIANSFKASIQAPKYQFGIKVPMNAKHALELDRKNGNNLWRKAIDLETKQINNYKTFCKVNRGENLADYTRIPYHIVLQ
jgi:hypothetical protein